MAPLRIELVEWTEKGRVAACLDRTESCRWRAWRWPVAVVYVQHADDTVARYIHLTNNGALVAVGDAVAQGQVIGLSGDTGNSTDPHLHLDVTEGCCAVPPDYNQLPEGQTRPLNFRNAAGVTAAITPDLSCGLLLGEFYTALPY